MQSTLSSTVIGDHEKTVLVVDIRVIAPDSIVEAMLRGNDIWTDIAHYAEDILRMKKEYLDHL